MLSGIPSAGTALQAEQLRAAAAAQDIAHTSTEPPPVQPVGLDGSESGGVTARDHGPPPHQGAIVPTGRPLDLAIYGNGFFQVRTASGDVALTRTGTFRTDGAGQIVTAGGVGLIPPLSVPPIAMTITVSADGVVSGNGVTYGRIQLVDVPAPERLEPIGDGLFRPTVASGGTGPAAGARIEQAALEQSDGNLVQSTIDLASGRHSLAANMRELETQDELVRARLSL